MSARQKVRALPTVGLCSARRLALGLEKAFVIHDAYLDTRKHACLILAA